MYAILALWNEGMPCVVFCPNSVCSTRGRRGTPLICRRGGDVIRPCPGDRLKIVLVPAIILLYRARRTLFCKILSARAWSQTLRSL